MDISVPVSSMFSYLYVCVQWLAQLCPLSVQLDQSVDIAALGCLLQTKSQRRSRAMTPPHKVNILILWQDEVFTLRPARQKYTTSDLLECEIFPLSVCTCVRLLHVAVLRGLQWRTQQVGFQYFVKTRITDIPGQLGDTERERELTVKGKQHEGHVIPIQWVLYQE